MKHELPKTLVGHGIAVFISARGVTETPAKELTEPFGDCKIAVIGAIDFYNPVTGAFTATIERGVPAQLSGNQLKLSGSLGTLHGAPIPPGTFATHVTATSTIDGYMENPAATVYLGAPVGDGGKAYHEARIYDSLFAPVTDGKVLLVIEAYTAGFLGAWSLSDNPRYYTFLDPVSLDKVYLNYRLNTGLIGSTDRVTILDDGTIEALAQFCESMEDVDSRSIPDGIQLLEPRNLGRFSELMDEVDSLGAFMYEGDPVVTHNDMIYLVNKLLADVDAIEKDLPAIRENLKVLKGKLELSPNYDSDILREICELRSTCTGDCNCPE